MNLCTRCAREQKTEKTRALATEEAPLSARLSLEGDEIWFDEDLHILGQCKIIWFLFNVTLSSDGLWWGWWHGVSDVAPTCLESTPMCIIINSGSTQSTRIVYLIVVINVRSQNNILLPSSLRNGWLFHISGVNALYERVFLLLLFHDMHDDHLIIVSSSSSF